MSRTLSEDEVTRLKTAMARISRFVDRRVSGDGLTRTQLSVLGTVARRGPVRATALAEAEGLNPTMLSRVLGKLEADGLLARSPDVADRRAVQVRVTQFGAELHQSLRRERTRLFADGLAGLPESQADAIVAALPAIEALVVQMGAPAGPVPRRPDRERLEFR